jgi:hypothetical protein
MPYRYTEEDLADIKKRQAVSLDNFQRNSGRGLPAETVKAMEKAAGVKMDENGAPVPKKIRTNPNKFGNVPTEVDGITFQSKLEARYYIELTLRQKAGDLLYFLRQVPFHLPGGVIYRVDFMEVSPSRTEDGDLMDQVHVRYVDTKGRDTQDSKNKIKIVQSMYGVHIDIVRKVKRQGKL